MNEQVKKITEALESMGFRVVAMKDDTCTSFPVISVSVVDEKWAQSHCPYRKWETTTSDKMETI
jgi:hypothetical protein